MSDKTKICCMATGPVGLACVSILAKREIDLCVVSPEANIREASSNATILDDPCECELGILAWWPTIIREPVLSLPRRGWVNLHPSLLPWNRGKYPNAWCLIDGTPAGVTIHKIDAGIDTGPTLAQERIATDWTDTGATIYANALQAIVTLFERSIDGILADQLPAVQQPGGTYHRPAELDSLCQLDLDREYKLRDLLNIIRARTFAPHPSASFVEDGQRFDVRVTITKSTS